MSTLSLNQPVPDFYVPATSQKDVLLSALKDYNVVLYFYPKDNTPGCTTEGQDFSAHYEEFKALKTVIFGVSRDNLDSHENFKQKQQFPFELISDEKEILCTLFDTIKTKNMYGRETLALERSTFLIDGDGVLRNEWRQVKVQGHVLSVLDAVKKLYREKYGELPKIDANKPKARSNSAEATAQPNDTAETAKAAVAEVSPSPSNDALPQTSSLFDNNDAEPTTETTEAKESNAPDIKPGISATEETTSPDLETEG